MDIEDVSKLLPHRYPFLLVDKVIECTPGESLVAVKNVTMNEPFFPGHFPQRPVMPGVLIIEALAQAAGILALKSIGSGPNESLLYLVGVDKARFKQPVVPGDQLILEAKLIRISRGFGKFSVTAKVDGKVVASADVMCAEEKVK